MGGAKIEAVDALLKSGDFKSIEEGLKTFSDKMQQEAVFARGK